MHVIMNNARSELCGPIARTCEGMWCTHGVHEKCVSISLACIWLRFESSATARLHQPVAALLSEPLRATATGTWRRFSHLCKSRVSGVGVMGCEKQIERTPRRMIGEMITSSKTLLLHFFTLLLPHTRSYHPERRGPRAPVSYTHLTLPTTPYV